MFPKKVLFGVNKISINKTTKEALLTFTWIMFNILKIFCLFALYTIIYVNKEKSKDDIPHSYKKSLLKFKFKIYPINLNIKINITNKREVDIIFTKIKIKLNIVPIIFSKLLHK